MKAPALTAGELRQISSYRMVASFTRKAKWTSPGGRGAERCLRISVLNPNQVLKANKAEEVIGGITDAFTCKNIDCRKPVQVDPMSVKPVDVVRCPYCGYPHGGYEIPFLLAFERAVLDRVKGTG